MLALVSAWSFIIVSASAKDTPLVLARTGGDPWALMGALAEEGADSPGRDFHLAYVDARLRSGAADVAALSSQLSDAASLSLDERKAGHMLVALRAHLETRYRDALHATEQVVALSGEALPSPALLDQLAFARAAVDVPPSRSVGQRGTRVPLRQDRYGKLRANAQVNGKRVELLLDTGAQISILAESVAASLDLKKLDGSVAVGTPTAHSVEGWLGVADSLRLGDMVFQPVLFLILPDSTLGAPDGSYSIPGIIGLQVMRTAGRVGWEAGGSAWLMGTSAPRLAAKDGELFWHDDGLGLRVSVGALLGTAFFDTGASRTQFRPRVIGFLDEEHRSGLTHEQRRRAGLGGAETVAAQRIPLIVARLGSSEIGFQQALVVDDDKVPFDDIAAIGIEPVLLSEAFYLDFESMRYRVLLPVDRDRAKSDAAPAVNPGGAER